MLALEERAIQKVSRRLLWFLVILYGFSYLDLINIGFASLSMNRDLRLTATQFGLANTIFYLGYILCEIPSNLMLARYGAKLWLPRILITWGLASAATNGNRPTAGQTVSGVLVQVVSPTCRVSKKLDWRFAAHCVHRTVT